MKPNTIIKTYIIVIVCLIFTSQIAFAAGIKERMKARLPVIVDLKAKGLIGENNQGYLGFVTAIKAEEAVIAAENKDRKAIYSHFAKQQNATVDVVEKIQAKRKAEKTKSGQFFQSPDGAWVKK